LDGFVLILGAAELTILLIFMLVSTRLPLYLKSSLRISKKSNILVGSLFILYLLLSNPTLSYTINFYNYYAISGQIVSADFFIFFYMFFIKCPALVFLITLLLGLLSIYFIILFYYSRYASISLNKGATTRSFIRRQALVKQANFVPNIRTMQ
jgi:hypothetical protein